MECAVVVSTTRGDSIFDEAIEMPARDTPARELFHVLANPQKGSGQASMGRGGVLFP
jgi:hypothetical protein